MKELIDLALNVLNVKGASYGDIRIIDSNTESIYVKNGTVNVLERTQGLGLGIRVIKNGVWGFAASSNLSKDSIEQTAALAVKVAESSARLKAKDIFMDEKPKIVDKYATKINIDPFTVAMDDKLNLLLQADELMRKNKVVKIAESRLDFWRTKKLFASTDGSFIEQEVIESSGSIGATAVKDGETGERSYPGFLGRHCKA
ncbi:MAG: TldD/PmbA family protein, partial [Candidatus Stahlbacteria bacterium]|nr:TldD/PmbA family protein [Candidatus Stahlbacteria bacterium]